MEVRLPEHPEQAVAVLNVRVHGLQQLHDPGRVARLDLEPGEEFAGPSETGRHGDRLLDHRPGFFLPFERHQLLGKGEAREPGVLRAEGKHGAVETRLDQVPAGRNRELGPPGG